jgi:hypothetical protein
MSFKTVLLASAILATAGCGSDKSDSAAAGAADAKAAMQQAAMPGGGKREALVISPRTYAGGSVKAKVTGFFQADGSAELNKPASITDEDQTWIQYGVSGAQELNVLFTNSTAQAENGVNVGVGPFTVTATSTSGECRTKFDVTPGNVSGHYSCKGSTGYNKKTGEMGKVDLEIDFAASSAAS